MTDCSVSDRAMSGGAKIAPDGQCPKAAETAAGVLVCVVDDDESVRDSFHTLLESLGFSVATYASGQDILADERRHQASCFIVDQHMPVMDGLATLGALRRDEPTILTVLVTGRLDAEIAARAAALDVGAILEKPFSTARLLDLIHGRHEPRR
jgi:two-component system response regulator FixJ